MPKMIEDFNCFCRRNIGPLLILLWTAISSSAVTGTVYYLALGETVSANGTQTRNTQSELERHIRADSEYQREVRQLLQAQAGVLSNVQSNIAVLLDRANESESN